MPVDISAAAYPAWQFVADILKRGVAVIGAQASVFGSQPGIDSSYV